MRDDFLYDSRPPLRKAFSDALYRDLANQPVDQKAQSRCQRKDSISPIIRLKYAAVALLLIAGLVCALSEPVRANTMVWIKLIAGFQIEERSESPLITVSENETPATQATTGRANAIGEIRTPSPTVPAATVYPVQTQALPQIFLDPPFPFGLPAWVPPGFVLDQNMGIAYTQSWISLTWSNPNLSEIELLVEKEYRGYNLPAGENSSQEIAIAGKPGYLVRGFWDGQHRWDPRRGISIGWVQGGHFYRLNYLEREPIHNEIKPIEGDMEALIETLVKMAGTIPETHPQPLP